MLFNLLSTHILTKSKYRAYSGLDGVEQLFQSQLRENLEGGVN